jgi:hypothetical protein
MRTYTIKPHQIKIYNEIKTLPKGLTYYVFQQSLTHPNLTLNELKKVIRSSVNDFCYENGNTPQYTYKKRDENILVKYYCFFETSQDFFWSQNTNTIVNEDIRNFGLHFHLFVSFHKEVYKPDRFSFQLVQGLSSIKHKLKSFSKFDYIKNLKLEPDFIYYHTKQMMFRYEPELILKNF